MKKIMYGDNTLKKKRKSQMIEKEKRGKLTHREYLLCARHSTYSIARNPTKTLYFYRG